MTILNEVIESGIDIRDYRIITNKNKTFPEEFECTPSVNIKNQGNKPTCVAHACASVVEYHHKVATGKYRAMSTEFIYGLRPLMDYVGEGMRIRDALDIILNYGTPYRTDCPGNNDLLDAIDNVNSNIMTYLELAYSHRIGKYFRCKSKEDIKNALMGYGPVVAAMVTRSGSKVVDDFYELSDSGKSGLHCVMICGWTKDGWLIQNSWGSSYAGDGKFKLPFTYKFIETWGVAGDYTEDLNEIKKPSKFALSTHRVWNKLANMWLNLIKKISGK